MNFLTFGMEALVAWDLSTKVTKIANTVAAFATLQSSFDDSMFQEGVKEALKASLEQVRLNMAHGLKLNFEIIKLLDQIAGIQLVERDQERGVQKNDCVHRRYKEKS